jgi:hypothetical protein
VIPRPRWRRGPRRPVFLCRPVHDPDPILGVLARCHGYPAVASDGPVGELETPLFPPGADEPDYLIIRLARVLRPRMPVVWAGLVQDIDAERRLVFLDATREERSGTSRITCPSRSEGRVAAAAGGPALEQGRAQAARPGVARRRSRRSSFAGSSSPRLRERATRSARFARSGSVVLAISALFRADLPESFRDPCGGRRRRTEGPRARDRRRSTATARAPPPGLRRTDPGRARSP